MRSTILALFGLAALAASALAQQADPRMITLDVSSDMPVRLPPPEAPTIPLRTPPPPLIQPNPPTPAPVFVPNAPQPAPVIVPVRPTLPPQYLPIMAQQPSGYAGCDCCSDGSCVWLAADYLFWWTRSQPQPPLVTASPAGTPQTQSGVLGQPGTTVLVGARGGVNGDGRSGLRVSAGFWVDECHTFGMSVSAFRLASQEANTPVSSAAHSQVARPFTDVTTGQQASELVGFPNVLSGVVTVNARNDGLRGANALLRQNCYSFGERCSCSWMRLDVTAGYAFFGIEESLSVREDLSPQTTGIAQGTTIVVQDAFRTRNEFHGGQFGLTAQRRSGNFWYQLDGALAMGGTSQTVLIDGRTTVATPDGTRTVSGGGLLAQASNSGTFRRDRFSLVPQFGLKLGYAVSSQIQLTLGYNFIYWSGVARPGDQIDLGVNPNRLPGAVGGGGPNRPAFAFKDSEVWAQGITAGIEISY